MNTVEIMMKLEAMLTNRMKPMDVYSDSSGATIVNMTTNITHTQQIRIYVASVFCVSPIDFKT